jgi:hypothetical protein
MGKQSKKKIDDFCESHDHGESCVKHGHDACYRCGYCHDCLVEGDLLTAGTDCGYGEPISMDEAIDTLFPHAGPVAARY